MARPVSTKVRVTLVASIAAMCALRAAAAGCDDLKFWTRHAGVDVFVRNKPPAGSPSVYFYKIGSVKVTANGAPNAYHEDRTKGLATLDEAGYPDTFWWPVVLVQDPVDPRRALKRSSGSAAGFFISKTALRDAAGDPASAASYVDASTIPYVSMPLCWMMNERAGGLGDAVVVRTWDNKVLRAIVADYAQCEAGFGIMSKSLASYLTGVDPQPRSGRIKLPGPLVYAVFPDSSPEPRWPRTTGQITAAVDDRYSKLGGWWPDPKCLGSP